MTSQTNHGHGTIKRLIYQTLTGHKKNRFLMKMKKFFTEAILATKIFNSQVFVIVFMGTLSQRMQGYYVNLINKI